MSRTGSNLDNYTKFLSFQSDSNYNIQDKRNVWVPDEKEGFLKGEVVKDEGGKLTLKMGDGDQRVVAEKDTQPANPGKFDGVKDCADLSYLNNATVLHNLRVRYDEDLIHTYSGLFLVVVNPYKWIPIYTPEIIQRYQGKRRTEVYPHTFAVADESYRAMLRNKANQSMLITGESGAGKTENTKKVIQYLATIAGKASSGGKLEQQILQANPMLEAFGNAKTNKNDNSSRFGKFIRIQFNAGGMINGTTIQSYLLEKSRVVRQGKNERNFHIFYQIIAGSTSAQKQKYHLESARKYGFFTDKDAIQCRSLNDEKEFQDTINAMTVIGLSEEEQDFVLRVVAGLLACGNLNFKASYGSEGSNLENGDVLDTVAELWNLDRAKFERALIRPRIKAGTEVVEKHLSVEQAQYSRDAMCKSIYERLFLWLVKKLNRVLAADREANFIGVLDIAGFEIFEHNSFEQLCINFTNEKLQQFFNEHMFKLEQEEYAREKIEWKFIDFGMDSQQTIDLIEKRPNSILSFLDEETIFPRATNESLVNKFHTLAAKHKKYGKVQFKKLNFSIQHYAGDVIYDVSGWIDKNKDPLQDDIALALKNSTDDSVSSLFTDPDLDPRARAAAIKERAAAASGRKSRSRGGSKSGSGASFMTVATTYKEQLNDLMSTLRATEPHFIRCIIPNLRKKPGYLQADLVLEQLSCNGVLEGIRISRKGFPNRIKYPEFVRRYYLLHPSLKRNEPESKSATKKVMQKVESDIKEALKDKEDIVPPYYQFGTTKIFFRHGVLAKLEEWREQKLSQMVITIQAGARGWLGRSALKKIGKQTTAAATLQKNVRAWMTFRAWGWWQLFIKSKPLLNKVNYDTIIADLESRVSTLEADIEAQSKERDTLRKDYEDAKDKLRGLREDLDAAKGRVAKTEGDRDTLEKENNDISNQISDLEDKLSALNKERHGADSSLKDTEADLADAEEALKKEEAAAKELEANISALTSQLEEKADAQSELDGANSRLNKAIQGLDAELRDAQGDLDDADGKVKDAQRNLDRVNAEIQETREDLDLEQSAKSKANDANRKLDQQVKAAKDDLDDLQNQLRSAKSAIENLNGEIDDTQSQLDKADKQAAELKKKQARLQTELEDARHDAEAEQDATSSREKKNKALQADIEAAEADLAALEDTRSSLDRSNRADAERLEQLKSQVEQLKRAVDKYTKQLAQLKDELNNKEDDLDAARRNKGTIDKSALNSATDELEDAQRINNKRQKDIQKLEKALKDTEGQLDDAESALTSAQASNSKLKSELADNEADLESLEKSNADLQRKLKDLQLELDETKDQIEEEADLKAAASKGGQKELDEALSQRDELERKRDELNDQLRKKTAEALELTSKASSAGTEEAKALWDAFINRLQRELDAAKAKLSELEKLNVESEKALGREVSKPKEETAAGSTSSLDDYFSGKTEKKRVKKQWPAWVLVQQRTFTRWCNSFLVERMLKIDDLEEDFDDGVKFCNLLEIISGEKLRYNKKPRMRAQKLENCNAGINFIKKQGIRLVGIGAEDIVDPKLKLILGLIWTVVLRYQISTSGEGGSAKKELLKWVRSKIGPDTKFGVEVKNFTKDWQDGKAICALVEAVNPGTLKFPSGLSGSALRDATLGMTKATEMGVPDILLPEDMVHEADELSNMTYISYFRDWEEGEARRRSREQLKAARADLDSAWDDVFDLLKQLALIENSMKTIGNFMRMAVLTSGEDAIKGRNK